MLKLKFASVLAAIGVLSSLLIAPTAAHADSIIDTSQLSLRFTPGVVPPATFTVADTGEACFEFSGGVAKSLHFQNVQLSYWLGAQPHSEQLNNTIERVDNSYRLCLYPEIGVDFATASGVALSGTLKQSSNLAADFGNYLASKSITLLDSYIYFDGTNSRFDVTLKNNSAESISYKVTNFTIDGQRVLKPIRNLIIPPNDTVWLALGEIPGEYDKNYSNLSAALVLTNGVNSNLKVSNLKLPSGVTVLANSAANWSFPAYNEAQEGQEITLPCLKLKNNSGKVIAIKSTLTWKYGKSSIKGDFGEVQSLGVGETACVSGIDSNDKYFVGDLRLGKKISVTGKVSLVKETTFDTSGLNLGGYTIQGSPSVTYNAATKKSLVTVSVTHATALGDALLSSPRLNGVQTDAAVVAGPCECGGPGYDYHSRALVLSPVQGDLRVGKSLKLSGILVNSTPLTYSQGIDGAQSEDGTYGCQIYHPEFTSTFDSKTNLTSFKLSCYNNSGVARSIDLSQVGAVAMEPGQANRNYSVIASALKIALPPKLRWQTFTVLQLVGDWRTGSKTLEISGYALLR